jgi:hypothetical protein
MEQDELDTFEKGLIMLQDELHANRAERYAALNVRLKSYGILNTDLQLIQNEAMTLQLQYLRDVLTAEIEHWKEQSVHIERLQLEITKQNAQHNAELFNLRVLIQTLTEK